MNRRTFLASAVVLPGAVVEASGQMTHVDAKQEGEPLRSSVVRRSSLTATGDAPGAKARTNFNGPTKQLAAVATGSVSLAPGARPHPPHQHPEEEFLIIGSGSGEIEIDGVVTQVAAGDMMYAEANVLHGIKNTGHTEMTFYFTKILAKNG
jgi:quercetin dioxygenase-like cupin family protein